MNRNLQECKRNRKALPKDESPCKILWRCDIKILKKGSVLTNTVRSSTKYFILQFLLNILHTSDIFDILWYVICCFSFELLFLIPLAYWSCTCQNDCVNMGWNKNGINLKLLVSWQQPFLHIERIAWQHSSRCSPY